MPTKITASASRKVSASTSRRRAKLPPLPNKPAPGTNRSATDNVPGVAPSGKPYAASAAAGNGNGSANGHGKNGNVAVMQRVFTLAEATGQR